ncbi:hypothetical protein [Kaarinaea lacus]
MKFQKLCAILIVAFLLSLSACGGGGGDSETPANTTPQSGETVINGKA